MVTSQLVDATARWLEKRVSRRGFLNRTAIAGSAVAVSGFDYVLHPGTAYASVCGGGSACGAGWTAMCCTINDGVNQCPPGSFAGGWWKADGASLCGGRARYYIDCQGECTHCGCGGGHFCASGCWNCRTHCANGTCDERRVCWNVFRYGQCHQEIGCSGPVLCRAISCTPPWKWESCGTANATDNNTMSHSAPCLANAWTAIQARYAALGSQGSVLGAEIGGEYAVRGGSAQRCENGRIYSSSRTGAHLMTGAVADEFVRLRETASPLGFPVMDQRPTHDRTGAWVDCEHGSIYWTRSTGAHALWTAIRDCFAALDYERSPLGWPTSTHRATRDGTGAWADFQHGGIYWTRSTGAHALWTAVYDLWSALDYERSPLGWPTTTQTNTPDGTGARARFQHGGIYWRRGIGSHALWDAIDERWVSLGEERSPLGWPVATQRNTVDGAGAWADFEHGGIYWTKDTGAQGLWVQIHDHWAALDYERSPLGWPTTTQQATVDGVGAWADFEHGAVYWSPSTDVHGVWGPIFTAWDAHKREAGDLGYPVSDVHDVPGGQRCDFQHGYAVLDSATGKVTVTIT